MAPWRLHSALTLLLLAAACDAPDPTGDSGLGAVRVVGIRLTRLNTHYPEPFPGTALNRPVCQVELDVDVLLSDGCAGFGEFRSLGLQGNTFRFQLDGTRGAVSGCAPATSSVGICLPERSAPGTTPPPLPPGHYVVIVNGFAGGFDIP